MTIKMASKQQSLRKNVAYISLVSIDYADDEPDDFSSPFDADGWEDLGFSGGSGDRNLGSS